MNVASLELCKELYELSGWKTSAPIVEGVEEDHDLVGYFYDLGYLLRKLQEERVGVGVRYIEEPHSTDINEWREKFIAYTYWMQQGDYPFCDTPEDAACKLAIELFKQGVLARGGDV